MRNERKFPLSLQWRKLMIIQALWVGIKSPALELLAKLWVLVPLQMSGAGFSFRLPTFPLMCVIIALTFPIGARQLITWHPPVPPVSAKTTAVISPTPWLLWGCLDCLDIYLFNSLLVTAGHLHCGWHLRRMTDGVEKVGAHDGNIMPWNSVNSLLHLLPRQIWKLWFARKREEI